MRGVIPGLRHFGSTIDHGVVSVEKSFLPLFKLSEQIHWLLFEVSPSDALFSTIDLQFERFVQLKSSLFTDLAMTHWLLRPSLTGQANLEGCCSHAVCSLYYCWETNDADVCSQGAFVLPAGNRRTSSRRAVGSCFCLWCVCLYQAAEACWCWYHRAATFSVDVRKTTAKKLITLPSCEDLRRFWHDFSCFKQHFSSCTV